MGHPPLRKVHLNFALRTPHPIVLCGMGRVFPEGIAHLQLDSKPKVLIRTTVHSTTTTKDIKNSRKHQKQQKTSKTAKDIKNSKRHQKQQKTSITTKDINNNKRHQKQQKTSMTTKNINNNKIQQQQKTTTEKAKLKLLTGTTFYSTTTTKRTKEKLKLPTHPHHRPLDPAEVDPPIAANLCTFAPSALH